MGNPVRSDLVTHYRAFIRVEQERQESKYHKHLLCFTAISRQSPHTCHFTCGADRTLTKGQLARDMALFTVAFRTIEREDGLSRTLIQRILRPPNKRALFFSFQRGKTMRDGTDHPMTVQYDTDVWPRAPQEEQSALGWNMTEGYPFPKISQPPNTRTPVWGKAPISAPYMKKSLKNHARNTEEHTVFTMYCFSSGGALSRALAGEDLPTITQRAFWKKPSTAGRYLKLMEVRMIPGSLGNFMATGLSP